MSKNVVVVRVAKLSFFVTKSSNFVIHEESDEYCTATRICDGVHNNGGWKVYMDTEKVVQLFADAYEQLA